MAFDTCVLWHAGTGAFSIVSCRTHAVTDFATIGAPGALEGAQKIIQDGATDNFIAQLSPESPFRDALTRSVFIV